MIEFGNPSYGWMELKIGDNIFDVSYLTDIWSELDYLFNLPDDSCVNRVFLEGESSGDVYLTAMTKHCGQELTIIWENAYEENDKTKTMRFPRKEFMEAFKKAKELIGADMYKLNFICEEKYESTKDVDNFVYDYKKLCEKYPNVNFSIQEEIDYDYEENSYISGYYLEIEDFKTGEKRYIEGD